MGRFGQRHHRPGQTHVHDHDGDDGFHARTRAVEDDHGRHQRGQKDLGSGHQTRQIRTSHSRPVSRVVDQEGSAGLPAAHRPLLPSVEHHVQSQSRRAEHQRRAHRLRSRQRHLPHPGNPLFHLTKIKNFD